MTSLWLLDNGLQLFGTSFLLVGLWLTGNRALLGPALATVSEVMLMIVGVWHGVWSLFVIGLALFFVQGRNFLKWRREGVAWW